LAADGLLLQLGHLLLQCRELLLGGSGAHQVVGDLSQVSASASSSVA